MAKVLSTNVTLDYVQTEPGIGVIDLAKSLSNVNRKSYRSGYIYNVDYIEFISDANVSIYVNKILEGYPTIQSWKMGFEAWKEQRSNALEENDGAAPGKWSDFKVFLNQNHQDGTWPELQPFGNSASGVPFAVEFSTINAEWDRADLFYNDVGAATVSEVAVGMLGDNDLGNDYGALIQTWGDTRAGTVAPDPNIPGALSGSWVMRMGEESGDMAQDVLGKLESENDFPPYANVTDPADSPIYHGGANSVAGGVVHAVALSGATGRPNLLPGGLFPLGLLYVQTDGSFSSLGKCIIRIHLTRGSYKGVNALPMGDFN